MIALMSRHFGTLIRFSIVGTIGLLVDLTLLYFLLYLVGTDPYLGRVGSFLGAVTVTWFLNRTFTFRDAAPEDHGRQWLRFVAVNSLGAVVNYGIYVLVLAVGTASAALPGIGVAAGSLAGLVFNYSLSRRFVFTPKQASG